MSIDWFTVLAQVINFLVLVWLLKRFLYRPILDAIDAREARIAKTLSDAASKEKQAQQQRDLFLHKNNQLDQQSEKLLKTATIAANAETQKLLEKARQVAAELCLQQQASFQKQQQNLSTDLRQKTQQEVFAITRQALSELADVSLEEQMINVFLKRLHELDENSKSTFLAALANNKKPVQVRTTFVLQPEHQKRLSAALNESFASNLEIDFETTPEVISGIELNINGQKLAWSISQYINSLEQHFQQIIEKSEQHLLNKQGCDNELQATESALLPEQFATQQRGLRDE